MELFGPYAHIVSPSRSPEPAGTSEDVPLRQSRQPNEEGKSQKAKGRPAPPPDGLGLRHQVPEVVGEQPGAQFAGEVPELELVLVNPVDVSHCRTR